MNSDISQQPYSQEAMTFNADPRAVRSLIEAERLSWGHLHNPAFAVDVQAETDGATECDEKDISR